MYIKKISRKSQKEPQTTKTLKSGLDNQTLCCYATKSNWFEELLSLEVWVGGGRWTGLNWNCGKDSYPVNECIYYYMVSWFRGFNAAMKDRSSETWTRHKRVWRDERETLFMVIWKTSQQYKAICCIDMIEIQPLNDCKGGVNWFNMFMVLDI